MNTNSIINAMTSAGWAISSAFNAATAAIWARQTTKKAGT